MEPLLWIAGYLLCGVVTAAVFIHTEDRRADIDPNSDDSRFPVLLLVVLWVLVVNMWLFVMFAKTITYAVRGCLKLINKFMEA